MTLWYLQDLLTELLQLEEQIERYQQTLEKIQKEYPKGDDLIQIIQANSLEDIEKPNLGYRVITLMNALHHFDDIPFSISNWFEIMVNLSF